MVYLIDGSKHGRVKFLGETLFKAGKWAGLELADEFHGKHDGEVAGVRYFQSAAERGVFVSVDKVSATRRTPSNPGSASASPSRPGWNSRHSVGSASSSTTGSRTNMRARSGSGPRSSFGSTTSTTSRRTSRTSLSGRTSISRRTSRQSYDKATTPSPRVGSPQSVLAPDDEDDVRDDPVDDEIAELRRKLKDAQALNAHLAPALETEKKKVQVRAAWQGCADKLLGVVDGKDSDG